MGSPDQMAPTCTVVDCDDDDDEDWDRRCGNNQKEFRNYHKPEMVKQISQQLQGCSDEDCGSEELSDSIECCMGQGFSFPSDLHGSASQSLSDDLEKLVLLLPHLNRESKLVQDTLNALEADIDIILSLQPGGDDDIPCGEDEVTHLKEKNGRFKDGSFHGST